MKNVEYKVCELGKHPLFSCYPSKLGGCEFFLEYLKVFSMGSQERFTEDIVKKYADK
jgi:hypothetical protein